MAELQEENWQTFTGTEMRRWLDSDLPKFQNIKCSYSYCQLVVMRGASCDCKTFSYISYHESCLKKENNKRKRSKCGTKAETEMSVPIQNRKKHKKQSTKQTKQKRLKPSSGTNVNGLISLLNLGPLGQVLCLDFSWHQAKWMFNCYLSQIPLSHSMQLETSTIFLTQWPTWRRPHGPASRCMLPMWRHRLDLLLSQHLHFQQETFPHPQHSTPQLIQSSQYLLLQSGNYD